MDWDAPNTADSFKLFQQRLELYFTIKKTPAAEQVPIILLSVGEEGLRRHNSWSVNADEKKDPKVIFSTFLDQLEPPENFRVCRLQLWSLRQQPGESIDIFVNRCSLLASKCAFSEEEKNERIIEILIASTPLTDLQKDCANLLSTPLRKPYSSVDNMKLQPPTQQN